jgi:hypothetical protein
MEILGRIHRLCRKMAKLELDLADGDPEQGAAAPPPADSGKTGGPDSAAAPPEGQPQETKPQTAPA